MRQNHKIKILDIGEGNYSFAVDNFSSLKHSILCSSVKPTYKFAWDAYKDAKNIAENNEFHLDILNRKYASDEYSIDKPLDVKTDEISADTILFLIELKDFQNTTKMKKRYFMEKLKVLFQNC